MTQWIGVALSLLPGRALADALPGVRDEPGVETRAEEGPTGGADQGDAATPREVAPGEASPYGLTGDPGAGADEVAPQEAAPQEAAPQEAAPQEAAPQEAAPLDADAPLDPAAVDPPPPPEPMVPSTRARPEASTNATHEATTPTSGPARAPGAAPGVDDPRPRRDPKIPHRGAIFELKSGVLGCTGALCADASGMGATPGIALDGFLGGNIAGFLDVGVEGGWGRMSARTVDGRNLAEIYGFDVDALTMAIGDDLLADAVLSGLTVTSARTGLFHGGPALRLHLVPRGRVSAYVGAGAQYQLWRTRYATASGDALSVGFHGTSFPLVAGVGGYVHRHIALGIEGRYVPSLYWIASVQSPMLSGPVPLSVLDRAVGGAGAVSDRLPNFWTLTATARVRF